MQFNLNRPISQIRRVVWNLRGRSGHRNSTVSQSMMTSSNGNIFRVTGPLCGKFTGPGEFPTQRPVTRSLGSVSNRPWIGTRSVNKCRVHKIIWDYQTPLSAVAQSTLPAMNTPQQNRHHTDIWLKDNRQFDGRDLSNILQWFLPHKIVLPEHIPI